MKPPPLRYARPDTLDEALALLADADDARCLAGGQSLMPILCLRLASSASLVDLARVPGLDAIHVDGDDVVLGAMARHRQIEHSPIVAEAEPLLARAAREIGHLAIRSRGTIGGSIAHADPAAEWPLLAAALDARIVVRSRARERALDAETFFSGPLATSLATGEIVTEIRFPRPSPRSRHGFQELCRRPGDFALVAVACRIELDQDGVCRAARFGVGGAHPVPLRVRAVESLLAGTRGDDASLRAAAAAASQAADAGSDLHASAAYRRRMVAVLAERALREAWNRDPRGGRR